LPVKHHPDDHPFLGMSALSFSSEISDLAARAALMAEDNAEQVRRAHEKLVGHLSKAVSELNKAADRSKTVIDRLIHVVQAVDQIKDGEVTFFRAQAHSMRPAARIAARQKANTRRGIYYQHGSKSERDQTIKASYEDFLAKGHRPMAAADLTGKTHRKSRRTILRALSDIKKGK
jgi:hypothetical protein